MTSKNDTQLWITTQLQTTPVIEAYYKDNYSEQAIMQFKLKYRESCLRSYGMLMKNPKRETLEVQLSLVCSPYIKNEECRAAIEIATLRYYRNRLTVESKQSEDIFNVVYKKLEGLNVLPDENHPLQAWELDEKGNRIYPIEANNTENSNLCSYVWLGNNVTEDLNKLFVELKKNKLIADDTDSVSFLSAFNGVEINQIENKIKWISSKKLSVYFINQLLQEPKLIEEKYMWSKLENLFIDKDGKPMDRGAQENQKIFGDSREARLPSNYMIINTILKGFRD